MPTIQGDTGRGTRLLPSLTAGQALGLLATAAAGWLSCSGHGAAVLRLGRTLPVAVCGTAFTIGRWPPGADGERLAVWLPRLLRYALRPNVRSGARVPGWEGLRDIRQDGIRHDTGWAIVLECTGSGYVLRGPEALAAAQVAYRELLHALEAPMQIVGIARWIRASDRPPLWEPDRAPAGLALIAEAYDAYWERLVQDRRGVVRRSLFVLSMPRAAGAQHAHAGALEAAVLRFADRLGLSVRRLRGPDLARLLLEAAGASDAGGPIPWAGNYRVGASRA